MCPLYIRLDWVEWLNFDRSIQTIEPELHYLLLLSSSTCWRRVGLAHSISTIFWDYSSSLGFWSFLWPKKKTSRALLCFMVTSNFISVPHIFENPWSYFNYLFKYTVYPKKFVYAKISFDSFLLHGKLSIWPPHIRIFISFNVLSIIKIIEEKFRFVIFLQKHYQSGQTYSNEVCCPQMELEMQALINSSPS